MSHPLHVIECGRPVLCPFCEKPTLVERERDGVLVDFCPDCHGVWLESGELRKLVARANAELDGSTQAQSTGHRDGEPRRCADRREAGRARPRIKTRSWADTLMGFLEG